MCSRARSGPLPRPHLQGSGRYSRPRPLVAPPPPCRLSRWRFSPALPKLVGEGELRSWYDSGDQEGNQHTKRGTPSLHSIPPPPLPCRGSCRGGPPPGRWAGAARTGRARCSRRASPGPPTAAPAAPAPRPLSHDPPQAPPHIPPSGPRPAVPASGYRTRATHSSVRAPPQAAPAAAQRGSRSRTRACQALTSVSLINRLAESASSRPTHPLVWPGHLQAGLITQPSSSRTTPWFGRVIFSSPCVAAPHSGRQSAENIFRAGAAHAPGQGHTDRQAATEA